MVLILPRRPIGAAAVADHYDELDPIYRALWGEHVHHGLWRSGRETATAAVEALSDAATSRKRWEFLLTAAPLPIVGGTGSPMNPIATF